MTDKEKIRAEIERRRNIVTNAALQMKDVNLYYHYSKIVEEYDDILRFIDSSKEPVSEELEEAAHSYASNNGGRWLTDDIGIKCFAFNPQEVKDAFKEGANWQKEKMMAKAIDGEVGYWNLHGLSVNVYLPSSVEEGDKVKVIVTKED